MITLADNSNNNNWNIGLGLELKPDAISNINEQIKSIGGSTEKIRIDIDKAYFKGQINSIKSELSKLSISQLTNIGNLVNGNKTSKSNKISIGDTKKTSEELDRLKNQIEQFTNMQNRMGKLKIKIIGLEQAGEETKHLKAMLEELESSYDRLWHSFQKKINTSDLVVGDFKKISNDAIDLEHKIEVLKAAYEDARISMAKDIQTDISNGKLSKQISNIETKFSQLSGDTGDVSTKIQELRTLMSSMDSNDDIESVITDYEKFKNLLAQTSNEVHKLQNEQNADVNTAKLSQSRTKLSADIDIWLSRNSAAAKQFGNQLEQIKAQISSADQAKLTNLQSQFINIKRQAEQAGVATLSFGDKLKAQMNKLGVYFSATMLISRTIQTTKQMFSTVIELDTALIDLKKTTTASNEELRNFYYSANQTAKELGTTTQAVIQAAADWSRLGYSIKEAEEMAKTSSIFASISPGLDINEATDGLVSAMKAFKIEADDALDGVASKINVIGNTQAVSNSNIVDFLTRSSSAMAEANNTLDETIALGTAITEITRDAANAGQVMKTASMRLRGYDEETEMLSDDVLELTGKIADLTKTASKPTGISLFTDNAKTQYKSTVQIFRDISEVYDELTDKQQAQLLEALGGKRGGQAIAAVLSNFDTVESSLESMQNSAGNAMKEMETIEQSLEYRLNALKETTVGTFQEMLSQDDAKRIIDFLTVLLELLGSVTGGLGLFGTAIAGVGIAAFIKNFD